MDNRGDVLARLHGAKKSYGALRALDGIDLTLRGGELLALLGPNGAGKTTAIGLLLGLLRADDGDVALFGGDPQDIRFRRHVGVMLQDADLPPTLRVGELIRLTASYYPAPRSVPHPCCTERHPDRSREPLLAVRRGKVSHDGRMRSIDGSRRHKVVDRQPCEVAVRRYHRVVGRVHDQTRRCSPHSLSLDDLLVTHSAGLPGRRHRTARYITATLRHSLLPSRIHNFLATT